MISHLVVALAPTPAASSGGGILGPIAKPIAAVLAFFYSIIPNYGVAIIILSLVWMIIIAPLTLKTTRSMLAMQKLNPQLAKLKEQHKNDRQAFAQAQMDLFKEHNVSPFGSCLPSILPLPVFFALFRVIEGLSHTVPNPVKGGPALSMPQYLSPGSRMYTDIVAAKGHINAFGLDLSKNALSGHSSFLAAAPFFILLLIMIGTQYAQTAQMMNRNPASAAMPQAKLMKFLPLVFGIICVRFPAGVVLYYGMSNICRIAQQSAMYRFDPKVKALVMQDIKEVETHTAEIDASKTKPKANPRNSKAPADKPPPPRSRFQALLDSAKQQQAERNELKGASSNGTTSAKARPNSTGAPLKKSNPGGGANGAGGGTRPKGPVKTTTGSKNLAAKTGGAAKPSGAKPSGAAPSNGSNGAGGNGQTAPPAAKSPGAEPRTGAGSGRTGARSGSNRKRRGQ